MDRIGGTVMAKIPQCRSMNFSVYDGMLDRYKDSEDLRKSYEKGGLNGLEVIRSGESDQGKILPEMVNGVHLYFHIFWMDWWKGDRARLDAEFDSREQWIEYYGSEDGSAFIEALRADFDYAEQMGAKYVVFHVAEVTLRESYIYQYKYTDEEVIDTAIEIINMALDGRDYSFDFLMENLWWSGLTLKDASLTKRLLDGVHYEKKGILLDTGHYMNNNCELTTAEEAVAYLHEMLDRHEEAGLLPYFKGVHCQMSLSGDYVKKQREEWETNPLDFDEIPFYELFRLAYTHACDIDLHLPFVGEGVKELMERIDPDYITFEFQPPTREEYEAYIEAQGKCLGYI